MDVRLPDGTIIQNVPEGTTQRDLLSRLQSAQTKPEAPGFRESARIGGQDPDVALNQMFGGLRQYVPDFMRSRGADKQQADLERKNAELADYEARRAAAGDTGFDTGRLVGNIVNPATMLPAMTAGRTATTLGRIGQGAAIGGVAAPLTTPATPDAVGMDFAGQKAAQAGFGAVAGGAAPAVWQGAKAAGRMALNLFDPLLPSGGERAAARLAVRAADAGGKRRDVIGELAASQRTGQTAGQTAVPAGSAEFSALQKLSDEAHPTPAAAMKHAQEGTRTAALRSIGQDKQALDSAVAARGAASDANYAAAFGAPIRADWALMSIAQNPYFKSALPTADKLAQAAGITSKSDLTQYLHFVKFGLDEQVAAVPSNTLGAAQRAAAAQVKTRLVKWLASHNPAYEQARAAHAAASKPINQMQVGQFLEQKLDPAIETGQRPAAFAQAMRDAPGTIKKSTGGPRYGDLGDVLTPGQKNIAEAVLANLQNDAKFNELAKMGMPATRKIAGTFADPVHIPNILNRIAMIVHNIANRLEGRGTKKTMDAMSRLMNGDPKIMADLMKRSAPYERRALVDAAMRYQAAVAGAATGND